MLTAARAVISFTQNRSSDDYEKDLLLRSAVERQIEIIGEAARRMSMTFQTNHADIPWNKITSQRHVLAHDYGEIKHDRIWRVVTLHLPHLKQLETLTPAAPAEP
jgi:uncharacterized protein with HEPN domain